MATHGRHNPLKRGWNAHHTKVLRLALSGKTITAIAKSVGHKRDWVTALMDSTEYKEKFEDRSKSVLIKVQKIFEESALGAARTIKRISRKGVPEERVQLDAAKDIIDRIGYKPIQIIETRQRAYTPQEIASAKETVKELEDSIIRLERKDSIFVLKKKSFTAPINEEPNIDGPESVSQPSTDRPETVSA